MSPQFDDWVRETLRPRHDARPRPGEVRRIIAGLEPRHTRRYRVALIAGSAVVVIAVVLLASPGKIGGDAGRFEITRVLPDGRLIIQQPLTGSGAIVKSPEEIDEWDRVAERTAAGEETIVAYTFTRFKGKTLWGVGYAQKDVPATILMRPPTYSPRSDLSAKTLRPFKPYLLAWDDSVKSGRTIACPGERHTIDGVQVDFTVQAIDIPGAGRLEIGEGKPPAK
jgi:hypothetical protein